tara:strand:+ start:4413 stop:5087 length:675 start_codon:yes stop_codon:yes gene_type:complete
MLLTSKIKFFKISLTLFLGILLSLSLSVNSSNQFQNKEHIAVVLGDSLSAGYGVKIEESWPSVLENNLKAANINIKIINAGISGDTTSGGLFRLPKLLIEHSPNLVILELGGNDGLRGMSIEKIIKKNLDEMIRMSLQDGAKVALVGVELPPNYGEQYTSKFKSMYFELANEYDLTLIEGSIKEMVALNLMQADGIHPNTNGHLKIEEEVRRKILTLLNERTID